MRAFIASLAIALAACGQAVAPPAPDSIAQTQDQAPTGEPMATGLMGGISTTSSGDFAALSIGVDRLTFTNADGDEMSVATEFLGVADASTPIVAEGESFSAAAPSATATRVELRRITGAAPVTMCAAAASYAALVSSEPLTGLQLMVFTGADAPGPNARDSAVCAIFAYAVD